MGDVQPYTLSAFPRGVDKVSPIDMFPELSARDLVNWYHDGSKLVLRGGISPFAAPHSGSTIKTLANMSLADGTEELVVAVNSKVSVENGTLTEDITGPTSPTSDEWQTAFYNGHLFMVNGADTAQKYDGSGNLTDVGFTGVSLSTLINVFVHNERVYFIPKNSRSIWYSPPKAAGGTGVLVEAPFAQSLTKGGYLVCGGSMNSGSGNLPQDLMWVLSSRGELLVYQGRWPGDSTFKIVKRFLIGKPLGYRSYLHLEDDVWFITSMGIVSGVQLFNGTVQSAIDARGRGVNPFIRAAAKRIPFSYMYSGTFWQNGNRAYIWYPVSGSDTRALVCNLETYAWSQYQYAVPGAAHCGEVKDDKLYVGGSSGKVYLAEQNYNDDGLAIQSLIRGGFNFFKNRGNFKVFKDIRPLFKVSDGGNVNVEVGLDTDLIDSIEYRSISTTTGSGEDTDWNEDDWDDASWSSEDEYITKRQGFPGQGHSGALRIRATSINSSIEFSAFEVRFEVGSQV
jgi:hypothetical protein